MNNLSDALVSGVRNAFSNLGSSAKVVLSLILAVFLVPFLLRVISFFRRGGEGV